MQMTVPNSYDTFSHAYTQTQAQSTQYRTEFVQIIPAMSMSERTFVCLCAQVFRV